jgi:hypothetical protein
MRHGPVSEADGLLVALDVCRTCAIQELGVVVSAEVAVAVAVGSLACREQEGCTATAPKQAIAGKKIEPSLCGRIPITP